MYMGYTCIGMGQLNINLTPEFERDLKSYMKKKGLSQKSEAIRQAVKEALALKGEKKIDFSSWIGLALKYPQNPNPRFKTDDDLWGDDDT